MHAVYVRACIRERTYRAAGVPYAGKNAITPRRIWRQCTGACHRASIHLSALPPRDRYHPCPLPSFVPSSLDRTCVQNVNCFSASLRALPSPSLSPYQTRLFLPPGPPPRRPSAATSCHRDDSVALPSFFAVMLKTRLRYLDHMGIAGYCALPPPPPAVLQRVGFSVSLSLVRRETRLRDILEFVRIGHFFCVSVLSGFLLPLASLARDRSGDKK